LSWTTPAPLIPAAAVPLAPDMVYLSRAVVEDAISAVDVVDVVARVLLAHAAGASVLPAEALLPWHNARGEACRSLNMPGLVELDGCRLAGTKVMNASVGNPALGLERAAGLVALFDPETARIRALLDAAAISATRTAAVTVLAAEHLLGRGDVTVCFLGSGPLAAYHADLMRRRWPGLRRIVLFDAVATRAHALADRLRAEPGSVGVEVAASAGEAVTTADLVVPVTTTTTPYVFYDWLRPGAVAVNVSLDDLDRETQLRADLLYVDDWSLVVDDHTRLLGRLVREGAVTAPPEHEERAAGTAGSRAVTGSLGQLLAGTVPGRTDPGQRVVVNPFGMALHDVAVASAVLEVALAAGAGQELVG